MNLDKTGYLPINQVTYLRKDKNVSKPDTSFRGIESETATDGESQKVSAENIKAYYSVTKPEPDTEKADTKQEPEYVSKEEAMALYEAAKASKHSEFKDIEPYIMTTEGKYSKKHLDIITGFNTKRGLTQEEAKILLEKINIEKVDIDALLKFDDIFRKLYKELVFTEGGMANDILVASLNKDGSFDENSLKEAENIISRYNGGYNTGNTIKAGMVFRDLKDIKSTDELSLMEKKELLTKLAQNPLYDRTQKVYDDIDVLPKTKDEYNALVSKLLKETSLEVKPMSGNEKADAINSLENLKDKDTQEITDEISKIFPELGKVDEKTVQTLQNLMNDERFDSLPKEDKLTAQLAVILKDSSSIDGIQEDNQSAFNAFYLAGKLGMSQEGKLKLYNLVKHQNLYENADNKYTIKFSVVKSGCELRHENSIKMLEMINDAKGIDTRTKANVDAMLKEVTENKHIINNGSYKITQTKLPKASQFIVNGKSVQKGMQDGIENTVVFFDSKEPIMYRDTDGTIKQLKPEDVYNYCHATSNINNFELATRPDSNYKMSTSIMNPTKGTHHMFCTEGVIVNIPKGNVTYEMRYADSDGTGFGKNGDKTEFLRGQGLSFDVSDKCAEFDGKQLSELSEKDAKELRESLDTMLSDYLYGENISYTPEPIGVFYEGPYKGYMPLYSWGSGKPEDKMSKLEKAERLACKLLGKEFKPKAYQFNEIPEEHRRYAQDNDLAVFHLGN